MSGEHSTSYIKFEHRVNVNGFVVSLRDNLFPSRGVPVHFDLEASIDGDKWEKIGASNFRWLYSGIRLLGGSITAYQKDIVFDFSPRWPFVLESFTCALLGICMLCASICGISGHAIFGKRICMYFSGILGLQNLVVFIGFLVIGPARAAWSSLWYTLFWAGLGLVLVSRESYFPQFLFIFGMADLIFQILNECEIFSDCGNLQLNPPVLSVAIIVMGILLMISKIWYLNRISKSLALDQGIYDAEWLKIVQNPQECKVVEILDLLVKDIAPDRGRKFVRHFNRMRASLDAASPFDFSTACPGTKDVKRPVTSLDQLYSQAGVVSPFLRTKCASWAAECGGSLCGEGADLKNSRRAIEKAVQCYGGDASRVVDICRCDNSDASAGRLCRPLTRDAAGIGSPWATSRASPTAWTPSHTTRPSRSSGYTTRWPRAATRGPAPAFGCLSLFASPPAR
jgi:hypothetical protein